MKALITPGIHKLNIKTYKENVLEELLKSSLLKQLDNIANHINQQSQIILFMSSNDCRLAATLHRELLSWKKNTT